MVEACSLYIHIPFCNKKCDYCHFYVIPNQERYKPPLMKALKKEWDLFVARKLQNIPIKTIYFGGGTPALLGHEPIGEILSWIGVLPEEITLEVNPENVTLPTMNRFREAGINRVSMGVQSLDNQLLKVLGREHEAKRAIEATHIIAEAGIHNLSVDLMYDLPYQTLSDWTSSLRTTATLPISHLSLYNLTIEPHTVFYKHREKLKKSLPTEELSLEMYRAAQTILPQSGLKQYEISAFAKEGYESQHNTGYWTNRPFLGMGPSAFSFWHGKRFRNIAHFNHYCQKLDTGDSPIDFEEMLEPDAQERERFVLNLRLLNGCSLNSFQLTEETLACVNQMVSRGLLSKKLDRVALTEKGILLYDEIASDLI